MKQLSYTANKVELQWTVGHVEKIYTVQVFAIHSTVIIYLT